MNEFDLRLGMRVRVNTLCPYKELIGMEGVVVGLRYERDGTINITMATDIHAVGDDGWKTMELDRIDD